MILHGYPFEPLNSNPQPDGPPNTGGGGGGSPI